MKLTEILKDQLPNPTLVCQESRIYIVNDKWALQSHKNGDVTFMGDAGRYKYIEDKFSIRIPKNCVPLFLEAFQKIMNDESC